MPEENEYTLHQAIRGVFSTEAMATVGFGSTKRRVKQAVLFFAEEIGDGRIQLRPLNPQFIPTDEKSTLSRDELLSHYTPHPNIYLTKVLPALRELEQTTDQADRCRESGQLFTAEFEYKNALRIDENHIRATFGLGLTYLDRGENNRADLVFCKLAKLKGSHHPDHKHLFNEFGMKLRKNGMLTQALLHYARALRISRTDEHLLYNIARVLFERGKLKAALSLLQKALTVRPDFSEAQGFKRHIENLSESTPPVDFSLDTFAEPALKTKATP